ncbi:MAG TPA: ATP-grasp domain-containing protein [Aequorivita sp.]|nr:ATP-grasp domain-containing protein [Aequorivita sp.]
MNKSNIKILITDVEFRKAFDVVNIMQRYYKYDCILCAGSKARVRLPLIYGSKIYKLGKGTSDEFNRDLNEILKKFKDQKIVYMPLSEDTTSLFYKYTDSHSNSNLFHKLPKEEYFDLTGNKGKFQLYCEKKGFPVPREYTYDDIESLKKNFRPLILKPHDGQGSFGIQYFHSPDELKKLKDYDLSRYILQDKVISDKKVIGAFFLCDNGKVINSYTHQRLRTFPVIGGSTVFSKTIFNDQVIDIGKRLLKDLEWNGMAMIEFMYDAPSKEWKIIELNPRIWGSIMLSAFNHSNFLDDYVRLCLGMEIEKKREIRPVYIRWLVPYEFLNLMKRNISLKEFLTIKRSETCYVNFTYSGTFRAFSYLLYFTFNKKSISRFIKKIF